MMGDLQRLWIYGRRGWSAPQHFPPEVLAAYEQLKAAGSRSTCCRRTDETLLLRRGDPSHGNTPGVVCCM
jgi:hypothetical protein